MDNSNEINELSNDDLEVVEDEKLDNEENSVFDKSKAKKNIIYSVILKVLILVLSLVARRFLIAYGGNDYNGLNSLYTSIIGFLAIADLGIGTAITFCMYEPIANGNISKVRQLYTLFKRVYFILGIAILAIGGVITFFLPYLAKGYEPDSTMYISYALSLFAVAITYLYSAKLSLINAYKNNYISTAITSFGIFIQYVLQIVLLIVTRSFIVYCSCKVVASLIQVLTFSLYNKYKNVTKFPEKTDLETKQAVTKNVKAMFMHKIGDVIFQTVDSLVISAIIGVVVLGYYSNYLTILTAMNEIIKLFIVPLTSVIGHMGVKATNKEKNDYFRFFYAVNFIIGIVFYLGYFSVCSDLVEICFGEGLELEKELLLVMSITYFIQFMRQSASVFKDSFGLFYKDRWLALFASIANACLSILLAFYVGIYGVLIATIVVDLLLYHIVEPKILFKYGFEKTPKYYFYMNYFLIAIFALEAYLFSLININIDNVYLHTLVMGLLSIAVNIIPVSLMMCRREFRNKLFIFLKR